MFESLLRWLVWPIWIWFWAAYHGTNGNHRWINWRVIENEERDFDNWLWSCVRINNSSGNRLTELNDGFRGPNISQRRWKIQFGFREIRIGTMQFVRPSKSHQPQSVNLIFWFILHEPTFSGLPDCRSPSDSIETNGLLRWEPGRFDHIHADGKSWPRPCRDESDGSNTWAITWFFAPYYLFSSHHFEQLLLFSYVSQRLQPFADVLSGFPQPDRRYGSSYKLAFSLRWRHWLLMRSA